MIQHYRTQLSAAEQKLNDARIAIGLFLNYVRVEAGLSDETTAWSLGVDSDGKPFLSGTEKK